MEFIDFSILSAIVESRKALSLEQLNARVLGYALAQIVMAIARLERDGLMTSQQDGRSKIYGLTRAGLEAQQNYLYASKDENDAAGIE